MKRMMTAQPTATSLHPLEMEDTRRTLMDLKVTRDRDTEEEATGQVKDTGEEEPSKYTVVEQAMAEATVVHQATPTVEATVVEATVVEATVVEATVVEHQATVSPYPEVMEETPIVVVQATNKVTIKVKEHQATVVDQATVSPYPEVMEETPIVVDQATNKVTIKVKRMEEEAIILGTEVGTVP